MSARHPPPDPATCHWSNRVPTLQFPDFVHVILLRRSVGGIRKAIVSGTGDMLGYARVPTAGQDAAPLSMTGWTLVGRAFGNGVRAQLPRYSSDRPRGADRHRRHLNWLVTRCQRWGFFNRHVWGVLLRHLHPFGRRLNSESTREGIATAAAERAGRRQMRRRRRHCASWSRPVWNPALCT